MTVIRPNSISGINSITGFGGDINLFRADGTKADIPIVNNITAGVVTATKFVGDMEPGGGTGTFDSLTVTGNLGVGGVLTYEDVTNIDSVGVITARSGIDAASNLLLKTGGNERLRINSVGDVGIGVNPDSGVKLHIKDTSADGAIKLEGTGSTLGSWIQLQNNDGAANSYSSIYGADAGGQAVNEIRFTNASNANNEGFLSFHTRPSGGSIAERLRINSDGHITKPSQAMFSTAGSGNAWVIFNSGSGWYNLGDSSFDGSSYYRDHGWTTTGRPGVGVRGVTSSGASVWDNAKGRFTAPVNGFYFFEINLYIRAYSGGHTFHVNPWIGSTNTDYYTSNIGIIRNSSNSVTGNTQQYPNSVMRSIVLYLTANQQFRWSVYAENDRFESYKSQAHQSGYLIG